MNLPEDSKKKDPLFRKSPFERLKIPEELDLLFVPVNTHFWLIKIALYSLATFGLLWLFLGSIPVIVEGKGIFISTQGLYSIQAKSLGIISQLLVKPGDQVHKGQLLALTTDPEEIVKFQNSTVEIDRIERELSTLRKQVQMESQAEKSAILQQIKANENTILELKKTIPQWEKELASKEKLYQQELIGLNDLQQTRELLSRNKIELETTKATLASLHANLDKMYRNQEVKEKERSLFQAKQQLDLIKLSLEYGKIYSPSNGEVLELLINPGDRVIPGTPLIHVESHVQSQASQLIYGFIPVNEGKKIHEGYEVDIEPSTVSSAEYGALLGIVKEISLFAVSKEKIGNLIQNESLVQYLMSSSMANIQIVVAPILDPTTSSGYKWSSGKGPAIKITTGTVCKITVITDYRSPIFYYFSLWRLERIKNAIESFLKRDSKESMIQNQIEHTH